ncbi:hypothetical protein F2P45_15035 [Massilia sp. CCM 8733]|uniref:DUF600 domain-containing protein n=1 Tax=Massilia mucilaginosa TaxID=2609282 RepID=A0ABX0NTZ7_9BURK|nr:hypothetical protein [Massilia mucilaginosa]NHZ90322.1 hypothetical protein [Massilia mucilaginosa]
MSKKDEIVQKMAGVLLEFMTLTKLDWDATYFRFASPGGGTTSSEWLYRKDRELNYFQGMAQLEMTYQNTLEKLAENLSAEIVSEGREQPVVIVATVDSEKKYNLKLDYRDPSALEIRLLSLGMENSYFGEEILIDKTIEQFQEHLKGLAS